MHVSNIRLGHATNSSSSHSIIILPKGAQVPSGGAETGGEFGWQHFVQKTTEDKLAYLAAGVGQCIQRMYGNPIADAVMREWFPDVGWDNGWFIDHQSDFDIPRGSKTNQISRELIQDFQAFLSRDDVVVLGGNDDNGLPDSYADLQGHSFYFPVPAYNNTCYASKSGDWWTVYNADTGAKVRFSFEENPTELLRSNMPELVDLKITNYCPFDCSYCYQSSTVDGLHADINIIKKYMGAMQTSGVFEIAIGGGEPTLHPDFIKILKMARDHNITPNFTTKVTPDKWSAELLAAVREHVGAFALSVSDAEDVEKLAAMRTLYSFDSYYFGGNSRIIAQFIVGAHRDYHLKSVIKECAEHRIPLTLLGYKDVGRGKSHPQRKSHVTSEVLKSAWKLSVDTAFIDLYGNILEKAGIPDVFMVPGEGRFSMYIDAVAQKAGISSYHTDTLQDFTPSYFRGLTDIWNALQPDV